MAKEIKIAATGDILMIGELIPSALDPKSGTHSFGAIFDKVAPYLRDADLTIGNLETPLAGTKAPYTRKNRRTGFSMFDCPEELAPALKEAGFDVMTTGNNHCMDRGEQGLLRTLQVLDDNGLAHTGTFANDPGDSPYLIRDVKGIRVGIVSYSKSTNKLPLPEGKRWLVNLVDPPSILRTVRKLKREVDLVVVCLHFGREYIHVPPAAQRKLVRQLLRRGVHIILGSHPHVLQPTVRTNKGQYAIFSLGNFISTRLHHNAYTNCGVIVQLTVRKEDNGHIGVTKVRHIPTWIARRSAAAPGGCKYTIWPMRASLRLPNAGLTSAERRIMRRMDKHAASILNSRYTESMDIQRE